MQAAAIETDLFQPLLTQGVDLAIFAITASGVAWPERVAGYDAVSYYVTPDAAGSAFQLLGADPYDVFLIDKKGRLVTSWPGYYDETLTDTIALKIRQLNDE